MSGARRSAGRLLFRQTNVGAFFPNYLSNAAAERLFLMNKDMLIVDGQESIALVKSFR